MVNSPMQESASDLKILTICNHSLLKYRELVISPRLHKSHILQPRSNIQQAQLPKWMQMMKNVVTNPFLSSSYQFHHQRIQPLSQVLQFQVQLIKSLLKLHLKSSSRRQTNLLLPIVPRPPVLTESNTPQVMIWHLRSRLSNIFLVASTTTWSKMKMGRNRLSWMMKTLLMWSKLKLS